MALNSSQKRKAREKLAKKRGVSTSSITDAQIFEAVDTGLLSYGDYGSSSTYDCGSSSSSYDSGSSSSSYDSGSSSCY
jgi:hypothetical protein